LIAQLSEYFSTLTLDQCVKHFADADCCLTPVLDLREAVRSSHHAQRGLVVDAGEQGIQALFPALVDGEPPSPRKRLKSADANEGGH
jgi:alpha-methylacyl-CoA racemase